MAGATPESEFLAAAGARLEDLLGGLSWLASRALGLGVPAGVLLAAFGLWLLADGARRPRALGAVGGAAAGAVAALAARTWLLAHLPLGSPLALAAAGAAGGAVAGGLLPAALIFWVGALPGGVLGSAVSVGGSRLAGLALGAAALGVLSLLGGGLTRAVVAGSLGALAGGLGGLAMASASGGRHVAEEVAGRPLLGIGWLLVVGAAGAARQLGAGPAGPPPRRAPPPSRAPTEGP